LRGEWLLGAEGLELGDLGFGELGFGELVQGVAVGALRVGPGIEPGVLVWRTLAGRTYVTRPIKYH
jgi:hypothetical protein